MQHHRSGSQSSRAVEPHRGWHKLAVLLRKKPKQGITLVIGAGIHSVPKWECPLTHESGLLLSSWSALLDATVPRIQSSPPASLRWELGILQLKSGDQAWQRSKEAFKRLQAMVAEAETAVLKRRCQYKLVKSIIGASCVKNIISLNFDLTIEQLLLESRKTLPALRPVQSEAKPGSTKAKAVAKVKAIRHLECCRTIDSRAIWHPHGDRKSSVGSCMGLREYALRVDAVEDARCKFQGIRRSKSSNEHLPNWIDLMMSTHLIFVGTSLDFSEWDIWFALVNRWRNNARGKGKSKAPQTFVLTTGDRHANLPSQFTRLSAPNYDQGWKWLDAVMNCPTSASINGAM